MGYSDVILAETSLLSYWRLGETSGTSAADSKGTNPGTYGGGYTLGQAGALQYDTNPAVKFDGANTTAVDLGTAVALDFNASAMTAEAWVWLDPAWVTTHANYILSKFATNIGWILNIAATTRLVQWVVASAVASSVVGSPSALSLSTWHHIVGTHNGSNSQVLYVDGASVATGSTSVTLGNVPLNHAWIANLNNSSAFGLKGVIDECAVYTAALTAAQVKTHYDEGTRTGPLVMAPTHAMQRAAAI